MSRSTLFKAGAIASLCLVASTSFASQLCSSQSMSPSVPDGAKASYDEMVIARKEIQQYVNERQELLRVSTTTTFCYDRVVDSLYGVADAYNKELREFLATNSSGERNTLAGD